MTAQLPQPVPALFVCWILMAPLVPTSDKTTGADGSWTSGVAAGDAERCSSFNIRVASYSASLLLLLHLALSPSSALGPLAVKCVFITSVSQKCCHARGTDQLITDLSEVSDLIRA